MKTARLLVVCAAALAPVAMAQRWEVGGGAGGGFYTSNDVSLPGSSVSAKIATNVEGSGWVDNDGPNHWGGEVRFDYQMGDFGLNGGGQSASFGGRSSALHYDVMWHFTPNGSKIRPYVALGAGIKVYQGTGSPTAYQPLYQYALLSPTQDLLPLISGGAGVKMQLSQHVQLRFEIHDYATPFPKQVVAPNQGAKVGGWLMDFVPSVGISYTTGEGR
jgi:hypothetical protein